MQCAQYFYLNEGYRYCSEDPKVSSGDPDVGEGLAGKAEVSLHILTDDGLLVVAGHVVPLDPVPVEVVQHGHAGLGLA